MNRYSEAISLLYSENTFMIGNEAVLDYLPILLLPQRINAIRSLRFRWDLGISPVEILFPYEPHDVDPRSPNIWLSVWQNMAAMEGLRTLHVELCLPLYRRDWYNADKARVPQVLPPIREVVRPKEFVLTLSYPVRYRSLPGEADLWVGLPCTVKWIEREKQD